MGFLAFTGRVLFASIFILSAWQMFNEFGVDGGPAAKELASKVDEIMEISFSNQGLKSPQIVVRVLVATSIVFKGLGGVLMVFGSRFGACILLLCILCTSPFGFECHGYYPDHPLLFSCLHDYLQHMALFGALMFWLDMKNSLSRRQEDESRLTSRIIQVVTITVTRGSNTEYNR